jgi:hypothetical protein
MRKQFDKEVERLDQAALKNSRKNVKPRRILI